MANIPLIFKSIDSTLLRIIIQCCIIHSNTTPKCNNGFANIKQGSPSQCTLRDDKKTRNLYKLTIKQLVYIQNPSSSNGCNVIKKYPSINMLT